MVMDLPYASRSDAAGNRGTPRRGICARRKRQSHALCVYRARGSHHRSGRADVFVECEGGLERDHLGPGRNWVDCSSNHDLRWMESFTRGIWCLSFRVVAMAWSCTSTEPSEYSFASLAGRALPVNDPDVVAGEHWKCRMGGSDSRLPAQTYTTFPRQSYSRYARFATCRPWYAV